jgi:hypothetical protein
MHTNVKRRMLIKKFVRLNYLFVVLGCLGAISMWLVCGQVLSGASPALAFTASPPPNTDTGLQALAQTLALDQITTLPQHEFRYELKYPRQDRPGNAISSGAQPGQETEDPSLFQTAMLMALTITQAASPTAPS